MQSGRKREIGEGADIVVCKIDGILVLEVQCHQSTSKDSLC